MKKNQEAPFNEDWWPFLVVFAAISRGDFAGTKCDGQPDCRNYHSCLQEVNYSVALQRFGAYDLDPELDCPWFNLAVEKAKVMAKELANGGEPTYILQDLAKRAEDWGLENHPAVIAMRELLNEEERECRKVKGRKD